MVNRFSEHDGGGVNVVVRGINVEGCEISGMLLVTNVFDGDVWPIVRVGDNIDEIGSALLYLMVGIAEGYYRGPGNAGRFSCDVFICGKHCEMPGPQIGPKNICRIRSRAPRRWASRSKR
jgi:hypothetical protein